MTKTEALEVLGFTLKPVETVEHIGWPLIQELVGFALRRGDAEAWPVFCALLEREFSEQQKTAAATALAVLGVPTSTRRGNRGCSDVARDLVARIMQSDPDDAALTAEALYALLDRQLIQILIDEGR